MTIENTNCVDEDRLAATTERSPDSKSETPTRGLRYGDLRGLWPGDVNDGFEKWVRETRNKHYMSEPPPWF